MKKNKTSDVDSKEHLYKYVKDHFWSVRNFSTATLSTTCRQLALGEGGLCWFIKSERMSTIHCEANIVLIMLILFFLFDASQYLISLVKYHDIAEDYEKRILNNEITSTDDLVEPEHINRWSFFFFGLKLIVLLCASLILMYLIVKM